MITQRYFKLGSAGYVSDETKVVAVLVPNLRPGASWIMSTLTVCHSVKHQRNANVLGTRISL